LKELNTQLDFGWSQKFDKMLQEKGDVAAGVRDEWKIKVSDVREEGDKELSALKNQFK
jgi:hypothetical protein